MSDINSKEKKKQHYVPKCYLENWALPHKHQVYVYDKIKKTIYPSNIDDIAEERYFYDIDLTKVFSPDELKSIGITKSEIELFNDRQFIENFFADNIEGDLKKQLDKFINRAETISPWEIKNCFFISEKDKALFSLHLAMQFVRAKNVRTQIEGTADCLVQILKDMGVPSEIVDKHTLPSSHLPYIHGGMIFDEESMEEIAHLFFSYSWTFIINKTSLPFYTSDSPIFTKSHIEHPFLSMNGLASPGVEVVFPISPTLLLVMCDGNYHKHMRSKDRKGCETRQIKMVEHYNIYQAVWCERSVYSNKNNFGALQRYISEYPNAFCSPRSSAQWGGKTYTPRSKEEED